MRVLISVDMEGVAGVVDPQDVRPGESEYERNRHLMTAEANAAVRGVLEYAPDAEVVVTDAHAQFRNLLPEELDRRARLIRGKPKPGGMLAGVLPGTVPVTGPKTGPKTGPRTGSGTGAGIDSAVGAAAGSESDAGMDDVGVAAAVAGKAGPDDPDVGDPGVDAVLFIGYHGRAGTPRSVLSHTVNSAVIAEVRINGRSYGEIGLNAAYAACHGAVPVLVSGDDTVGAEAGDVVPGIHAVEVKWALGARAAESLHPDEACDRIQAAVSGALGTRAAVRPPRFDGPVELEVDVLTPAMTEHALLVPGVQRAGGRTLCYRSADFPTAYGMVSLFSTLGAATLTR